MSHRLTERTQRSVAGVPAYAFASWRRSLRCADGLSALHLGAQLLPLRGLVAAAVELQAHLGQVVLCVTQGVGRPAQDC
jgi:hypothetical protein